MKVKLLHFSGLATALQAAACCTSSEMPENPSPKALASALKSGHLSVLEHEKVSFSIEGISRVAETQLVRHRLASYSIQSGRYCTRDPTAYVVPDGVIRDSAIWEQYDSALKSLDEFLKDNGILAEDRRYLYPQGITTNIVMTCNLREFSHMCALRRCRRAQCEIGEAFDMMARAVTDEIEGIRETYVRLVHMDDAEKQVASELCDIIERLLEPQCKQLGHCPEARSCGRF